MKRTGLVSGCLRQSFLICCLFSSVAVAGEFSWTSATHEKFEADFNQDGHSDLLLQAKTAGHKHYFIAGQAGAKSRYDYSKHFELPKKLADLHWTADKVQLLPIKLKNKEAQGLLVLPRHAEKALLFTDLIRGADLEKAAQVYELKQNKWLKDSDAPFYHAGDFDGDGQQDLLQLDAEKGAHQVILFGKNQKLKIAKKLTKAVRWGLKNSERLIIGDFNQDGRDDVFALSRDGAQSHVLLYSNGKGGFSQEDGKFIPTRLAHLQWADNASGIAAVRRKSDNQTVLFRAYNSDERDDTTDDCLGWVYDTETETATEYCPTINKNNAPSAVQQSSGDALNNCPIELSIGAEMTTMGDCGHELMPVTPSIAPQVNGGPYNPGEFFSVVVANISNNVTMTFEVWAVDANGVYSWFGDASAPGLGNNVSSLPVQGKLATPGIYNLRYRGCGSGRCSGFSPPAAVAIRAQVVSHTVTTYAGAGGSISPSSRSVSHGQTTTFTLTPNTGYTATAIGCAGSLSGTTYTTGSIHADCTVSAHFNLKSYPVSAAAGANGTISPASKTVSHGQTTTFTITPNSGYSASVSGCDGRLAGTTYTTGLITGACSVSASFTAQTVRVNASAGAGGTINPSHRDLAVGQSAAFTVTANSGYTSSVNSGCGGSMSGNTFTTGPVTANCAITASFSPQNYPVSATAGANGSISPASRTVRHGDTTTFTVAPNVGYVPSVNSSCGGTISGNSFTTGSVTANCAITASFSPQNYTVSATAGANGAISPATRSVRHGQITTFTVTPNVGYVSSVHSSCGGSMSGNTFTTSPVTANCAVSVSFSLQNYLVSTMAGANGSISPSSKSVSHGQATTFTVAPNAGYTAAASGCGGTLSGTTYTTGAITGVCTVTASFTQQTHRVSTSAGANGSISPTFKDVPHGQTTSFTVTPNAGYIAAASGCGGGLSGTTYTTGVITGACTVSAAFTQSPSNPDPVTKYEYDARGRLVKLHDNLSKSTTYVLDHTGNRLSVSDQTAPVLAPKITSFEAPREIAKGGTATIRWTSQDSLYCALAIFGDNSAHSNLAATGSLSLQLYEDTGITLSCYYGSLSAVAGKNIRIKSFD